MGARKQEEHDPLILEQERWCPGCGATIPRGTPLSGLMWLRRERAWYHGACVRNKMGALHQERARWANDPENQCWQTLTAQGLDLRRRGYPDFWWISGGQLCFVEVKPREADLLKTDQLDFLLAARRHGCKTFRFTPDGGLKEVTDDEP